MIYALAAVLYVVLLVGLWALLDVAERGMTYSFLGGLLMVGGGAIFITLGVLIVLASLGLIHR